MMQSESIEVNSRVKLTVWQNSFVHEQFCGLTRCLLSIIACVPNHIKESLVYHDYKEKLASTFPLPMALPETSCCYFKGIVIS